MKTTCTKTALLSPVEAVEQSAKLLLKRILTGTTQPSQWESLRGLLESLPLATAAFATAVNRLSNARMYYEAEEVGAAAFEIRLLLGLIEL